MIDCRFVPENGWAFDAYPAEVAAYEDGGVKEWSPAFLSAAEYAIVVKMRDQLMNLDDLESEPEFKQAIADLIEKRIVGPITGESRRVENLLRVPMCVRLPDHRYAVGENNSGRMTRWCQKHFPNARFGLAPD